ncbi:hypothetical protein SAMN05660443_1164 [Marinospirillum celere]|uniref:Copper(I)-binding protein n=1 Tax=Marinospirillum celere TaxID=1122252 RepID=A0A1I1FR47_9GAMM|nr:copper chaperone PCu(A)C [Marinospirillum celere]SFC01917.1 hypothetical protein SAMN05660443_1164 [Marinospirillum celere]
MLRTFFFACLLILAGQLAAHDFHLADLRLVHPFATPTPPSAQVGAVYFDISNESNTPARLVSARANIADKVELHDMAMDEGIMKMRQVSQIEIAGKETLKMRPGGGYHLMLIGLQESLTAGDSFPLWLTFEQEGEIRVDVWVEEASEGGAAADAHHHHHH